MWKAEKIELTKNCKDKNYGRAFYLLDCFTLKINDVLIHNAVKEGFSSDWFERFICDECGVQGCNGERMLMMRRQGNSLLFLPVFDLLDSLEEYNYDMQTGDRDCPPHQWYENGILIVDGKHLKKLYELIPELETMKIPEISEWEMNRMLDWESAVKTKPKGFMIEEKILKNIL